MVKRKIKKRKTTNTKKFLKRKNSKKTKAQMMGTVFILILGAMIFILILSYGYKAINNFIQKQEQVALIEFQTELESSVKAIALDYGSVKKVELRLTKKAKEVCFVGDPSIRHDADNFEDAHPLLFDAFISGTQNVFIVPLTESAIFLENMQVKNGWFCAKTPSNRLVLRVEGLGNKAGISQWVN